MDYETRSRRHTETRYAQNRGSGPGRSATAPGASARCSGNHRRCSKTCPETCRYRSTPVAESAAFHSFNTRKMYGRVSVNGGTPRYFSTARGPAL